MPSGQIDLLIPRTTRSTTATIATTTITTTPRKMDDRGCTWRLVESKFAENLQRIDGKCPARDLPASSRWWFCEILEIWRVDACVLGRCRSAVLSHPATDGRSVARLARRQGYNKEKPIRIRTDRMYNTLYIKIRNWLSDRWWAAGNRISSSRSCLCPCRVVSLPRQVSPAGFFAQTFAWPVDRQRFAVPFFSPVDEREK